MRTRPPANELPTAAWLAWSALDRYEIRSYSRVVGSVLSGRLAQLGRAWKGGTASAAQKDNTWRKARKWADVTTTRGLDWLVQHGEAKKVGVGYLRARPAKPGPLTELLDIIAEAEQRLRGVRIVLATNPDFPGEKAHELSESQWRDGLQYLLRQMDAAARGIRRRESERGHPLSVRRPQVGKWRQPRRKRSRAVVTRRPLEAPSGPRRPNDPAPT